MKINLTPIVDDGYKVGDVKIIERFLWFPKIIENKVYHQRRNEWVGDYLKRTAEEETSATIGQRQIRWLERAKWAQQLCHASDGGIYWFDMKWID